LDFCLGEERDFDVGLERDDDEENLEREWGVVVVFIHIEKQE
jgi:hypothetical protein